MLFKKEGTISPVNIELTEITSQNTMTKGIRFPPQLRTVFLFFQGRDVRPVVLLFHLFQGIFNEMGSDTAPEQSSQNREH